MKRSLLEQILLYDYRYFIAYSTILILGLLTHFWRLGSLVPGLSGFEAQYVSGLSLAGLFENPLFWPHKAAMLAAGNYFEYTAFGLRLVTVIFALLAAISFFWLVRSRFKDRVAIISVGLLVTSSWWLSYARLARPEILIPFFIFLLMLLSKKAFESPRLGWLLLLTIALGLSLYIPALPYVVLVGAFVTRSLIKQVWRGLSAPVKITLLIALVIMTGPLLVAIGRDLTLIRELLLLPGDWPSPLEVIRAIGSNLGQIFWSRQVFWPLGLGELPLLDLFTAVMIALGLYHLDHEISRSLAHFVLVGLAVLLILTSLKDEPTNSIILLPLLFMLLAAGIVMLLSQWYEIFPRNPVARLTAFLPTALLLLAVVWYHQQRFFIAWPQTPEVVEAFPPTSEVINEVLPDNTEPVLIIAARNEVPIVQIAAKNRAETAIVAAEDYNQPRVATHQSIIVTDGGLSILNETLQRQARSDLKPVYTAFSTHPVAVWTNIPL